MAYVTVKMAEQVRIDIMKAKGTYVEPEVEQDDALTKFLKRFSRELTDRVPMEEEASIDTGHNYDGIRELDNNLPPWWTAMFYISIIFAVGYLYYYHLGGDGISAKEAYEQEMHQAEVDKKLQLNTVDINDANVVALTDESDLSVGKGIFMNNCISCHGPQAQGMAGLGPNLTDDYWIHGGGIHNVFKTITEGVPAKGMISWKNTLPPAAIQKVASYVLSLRGSNPPGAKAPQGDLYVPEKDSTNNAAAKTDSTATAVDSTKTK
jgi:cytochrome c oxidase cbb3-type subunit 3